MKLFFVDQIKIEISGEPACIGEGVLFSDGSVALSLTLPRIWRYYAAQRSPAKADERPIPLTFPSFEITTREQFANGRMSGFRNEFAESSYTVRWA